MTEAEEIIELKNKITDLEKSLHYVTSEKEKYENGDAKLYYALQRKMTEISLSLNAIRLNEVDMASKSDATFDRAFKLLEKCETISTSAASLGIIAGVTGDEQKDTKKQKTFLDTYA